MKFTSPAPGGGGGSDPLDQQHLEALLENERRDKAHVIGDLDRVVDALCVLIGVLDDVCELEQHYRDKAKDSTRAVVYTHSVASNLGAALMDYEDLRRRMQSANLTLTNEDGSPKSSAQLRADITALRQGH